MNFKQYLKKTRLLSFDPGINPLQFEEAFYKFSVFEYLSYLKKSNVDNINLIAENKILKLFQLASELVPAYKDFLKKNKISSQKVKTITDFEQVPLISKDNYLRKYPSASLMWNGSMAGTTMISVSSGSTGKPYYWPRDLYLEHETAIMHEIFSNIFFDIQQKSTLVVDAYAMGMYVAGTFTLNSFRKIAKKGYKLLSVSPGIEDKEVIQIVKDIGKQ